MSRHPVRLRAGQVGFFQFGEAWFHVDPEASREAGIPPYIAACHEDAHRRTQFRKFTYFQHFLSFAGLAAENAHAASVRAHVEELQAMAVEASVFVQEGAAVINMLMRCFPNYTRHFDRLYELFSTTDPYATGLRMYEALLGKLPEIIAKDQGRRDLRDATEFVSLSLAGLALDGNVLGMFPDLGQITVETWREYLKAEGPDARLQKLIDQYASRLQAGELSSRYLDEIVDWQIAHDFTVEGKPGKEHIQDEMAVDVDRAFLSKLQQDLGQLSIEVIYQYSTDTEVWKFSPKWLASLDHLFPVDRGLRIAWLNSTFGHNYTVNEGRFVGPGRLFRLAVPAKWVSSRKLSVVELNDEPALWLRIEEIADEGERLGLVTAISFTATDGENVAVTVSLWHVEPDGSEPVLEFAEVYKGDLSIEQRPARPRKTKFPWVIHADAYSKAVPAIEQFLRPGDISVLSSSALDTYDLARGMDGAVIAGRNPLLLPSVSPTRTAPEPGESASAAMPSSWLISELFTHWRWALFPGEIDAMEHVILERETLTQNEKASRLAALDHLVRSIDVLGPEQGLKAAIDAFDQAIGFSLDKPSLELRLIHNIARPLAFLPESILGQEAIVVPESRLKPYSEPMLSKLEARYALYLKV